MTFDQVLPDFKAGKKIRRKVWKKEEGQCESYGCMLNDVKLVKFDDDFSVARFYGHFCVLDILADDWEVLE